VSSDRKIYQQHLVNSTICIMSHSNTKNILMLHLLLGTEWKNVVLPNHTETLHGYSVKVSGILDMIHRNCMKVAFFGR